MFFTWFSAHLADIIILALIALAVFLVIRSLIRDRKAGRSSCGGNCSSCGVCSSGGCGRSPVSK